MPERPRNKAQRILEDTICAVIRARGDRPKPAWSIAEHIVIRAIVGSERAVNGLRLIDVLAGISDEEIVAELPRFRGMRDYAKALAAYEEQRWLD